MPLMEGPMGILTLFTLVYWVIVIKYVFFCYFWRQSWIFTPNILSVDDQMYFESIPRL